MKFDHHIHTSRHSPDSIIAPDELIKRAQMIGLDGVVITEHDYQWEPDELEDLASRADGLVVLSGVEVSAIEGHFLVYGLPNLDEVGPGITLAELLAVVRRHDAAIVAAHPYRWEQDFDSLIDAHGPAFDALELVSSNVTVENRARTAKLLQRFPIGATGSSDGHTPDAVGCYFTAFDGPITTVREFVEALRTRQGRPRHCAKAAIPLASGPVHDVDG